MPRYVILRHEGAPRGPHWDFMLETEGALWTWSLAAPPEVVPDQLVDRLPNHRLAYLDFEGDVSGGRGTVLRHDWGEFDILVASDMQWIVRLRGERLREAWVALRLAAAAEEAGGVQRWSFSLGMDSKDATGLNSGCQTSEPSDSPRVVRPAT